jgi:twitching motility protein PilT
MSLVPSLLQAIVHLDGEALVMHAGDKPYVVSPSGQVDLATRGLALDAINGIVNQLLPVELQTALDEFGAVQYDLPARVEFPGEHFTVVAARGGDDVWVEVRRRNVPDEDRIPNEFFPTPEEVAKAQPYPVYAVAGSPELRRPSEPLADSLDVVGAAPEFEISQSAESTTGEPLGIVPGSIEPEAKEVEPPMPAEPVVAAPPPLFESRPPSLPQFIPPPDRDPFYMPVIAAPPAIISPPAVAACEPSFSVEAKAAPQAIEAPAMSEPPPCLVEPPTDDAWVDVLAEAAIDEPDVVVSESPAPEPEPYVVEPDPPPAVEPEPQIFEPAPPPWEPEPEPEREPEWAFAPEPGAASEPMAEPETFASHSVETPPQVFEPEPKPIEEPVAVATTAPTREPEPEVEHIPPVYEMSPVAEAPPVYKAPPPTVVPPALAPLPAAPVAIKEAPQPAVVLPLARNPVRFEHQLPLIADPTLAGLDRLLRLAAARGASTLYLSSQSRASVRVDGELQALEGEPILTSRDVESLLLTLMPERNHEALRSGAATEWILDIEDVGRVRCMSFRDHLGPGGVFRLMPTRSVSADQLSLPRAVQALAIEPEGLLLIAGPRSSGKRTLMSAVVDLINRTRRDHVITIEREINIVHERGSSFISQREVRGNDDDMLAAAQAALREDPDILMIEELRTAGLISVALDAAQSGHLVIGSFSAHTATAAVDRIIDLYAPEQRRQVQLALADCLRGVVSQVLLKKNGGGRVAAREVLLNTPAVSSVIAEGKTSQLPMAIEGGRRYGMIPLNDALVGLVQQGVVDGREAYRYSSDRPGLLAYLERQGVDTSFVEKLA